jgi:phosphoribosylanthranilate isomerase
MTRVKICGIRDPETAIEAVKAGADMIGLMFAESKRRVTPQECYDVVAAIHELRGRNEPVHIAGPERGEVRGASWFGAWSDAIEEALFRGRPLVVGVFADMSVEEVNNITEAAKLDLVQLSGGEDEAFIDQVDCPVLKAIHVSDGDSEFDIADRAVPGHARAIMLDTASASARGGTGERFDWAVAAEVAQRLPIMLAGGLRPDNVAEAVSSVKPWAVDVSSGVERDGKKDVAKVQAFVAAVKEADRGH